MSKKTLKQFSQIDGRIGNDILDHFCCFFDFPHSQVSIGNQLSDFDFSPDECIEVPFQIEQGLIVLNAETDLGAKKLFLDTGANVSILRGKLLSKKRQNCKLILEGQDFGKWDFWFLPFTERLQLDGALGIDFFKKNLICIDFKNHKVYIRPYVSSIQILWDWISSFVRY